MSLSINHNLMAGNTANNLNQHYSKLGTSTGRLSSGLRINSSSDDAAGLAIRELQRADITTLKQGVRNANDAISMIQVADGALQVIDEKLIRMKELAEQAATGTYDSTQRLMISSEFQAMAAEIDRIANATDFNNIHLLNGNLHGAHDGSGLQSTGAMKVHFGTGNDSAEDYYYVDIEPADILGLGLGGSIELQDPFADSPWNVMGTDITTATNSILGDELTLTGTPTYYGHANSLGIFTNGQGAGLGPPMSDGLILSTGNVASAMNLPGALASSSMGTAGDVMLNALAAPQTTLDAARIDIPFSTSSDMIYFNFVFASEEYPAYFGSINDVCGIFLDGVNMATLDNVIAVDQNPPPAGITGPISINNVFSPANDGVLYVNNQGGSNSFAANGFTKTFRIGVPVTPGTSHTLTVSVADAKDSVLDSWIMVNDISASPQSVSSSGRTVAAVDIKTQDRAQYALDRLESAIVHKDAIRAGLGAMQNRLENTISNLNIQAENLQASESRISDVDVATEMTEFTKEQILTQAATAMLAQANSLPKMALQLIGS